MHDAAQFFDALDEKRMQSRIPDLLGEAARLVVKGVMHRPAGDGSNAFIEVDGRSALRIQITDALQFLGGGLQQERNSDLFHTHANKD